METISPDLFIYFSHCLSSAWEIDLTKIATSEQKIPFLAVFALSLKLCMCAETLLWIYNKINNMPRRMDFTV